MLDSINLMLQFLFYLGFFVAEQRIIFAYQVSIKIIIKEIVGLESGYVECHI